MTDRDPNTSEYYGKSYEYISCFANYFLLSDESKLKEDLDKKMYSICKYELNILRSHKNEYKGTNPNHFEIDLNQSQILKVIKKFDLVFKLDLNLEEFI